MVDHNSEILTETLLRHWERENKPTEFRGKDELEKEVEWLKGLDSWKKSITTKSFIWKKQKQNKAKKKNKEHKTKDGKSQERTSKTKTEWKRNIKRSIKDATRPMFHKRH